LKVYDPSVVDKTSGTMTLTLEIPERIYAGTNPDGTRPVVSLKTEAPTLRALILSLKELSEVQTIEIGYSFGADGLPEDYVEDWEAVTPEQMKEIMQHEFSPFRTTDIFEVDLEHQSGKVENVKASVTAPSGLAVAVALQEFSSERFLTRLMTSFMPDEYDYDDDYEDPFDL